MARRQETGSLRSIGLAFLFASSGALCGSVEDYHAAMIGGGKSDYPSLSAIKSFGKTNLYLVTGDILSFIEGGKVFSSHADALIVSTNVDLDFGSNNPRIQKLLRNELPRQSIEKIKVAFSKKGKLRPTTEPLVVDVGTRSPRQICFLATDHSQGGTYNDKEWQTFLHHANIETGVENCLKSFKGAKTVVIPLIGSSANPRTEGKNYIDSIDLREEHISRRVRSLQGIVKGVKKAQGKVEEVGVILWNQDVRLIIHPKLRENREYESHHKSASYWDFRNQFLDVVADR